MLHNDLCGCLLRYGPSLPERPFLLVRGWMRLQSMRKDILSQHGAQSLRSVRKHPGSHGIAKEEMVIGR